MGRSARAAIVVAIAVALGACGGGSDPQRSATPRSEKPRNDIDTTARREACEAVTEFAALNPNADAWQTALPALAETYAGLPKSDKELQDRFLDIARNEGVAQTNQFIEWCGSQGLTVAPATLADGATNLEEARLVLANAGIACAWQVTLDRAQTGDTTFQVATCGTTNVPSLGSTAMEFFTVFVGTPDEVAAYLADQASDQFVNVGVRGSNWLVSLSGAGNGSDPVANADFVHAALGYGEIVEDARVPLPPMIMYEVSGSGEALVTYFVGSAQQQETVTLPWQKGTNTSTAVVSAQRQSGDNGEISCRILRDGTPVSGGTSSGPYAVVTCSE